MTVIPLCFYHNSIQLTVSLNTPFITHRIVKQLRVSILHLQHHQWILLCTVLWDITIHRFYILGLLLITTVTVTRLLRRNFKIEIESETVNYDLIT